MDILKFFRINLNLQQSLDLAQGQIIELREYNNYLKNRLESYQAIFVSREEIERLVGFNNYLVGKLDKLEDILYKRFGLLKDIESPTNELELEPIKTSESWPSAKRRFENASRTKTSELDKERQEYWHKRNENQAKAREEALKNNEVVNQTNGN